MQGSPFAVPLDVVDAVLGEVCLQGLLTLDGPVRPVQVLDVDRHGAVVVLDDDDVEHVAPGRVLVDGLSDTVDAGRADLQGAVVVLVREARGGDHVSDGRTATVAVCLLIVLPVQMEDLDSQLLVSELRDRALPGPRRPLQEHRRPVLLRVERDDVRAVHDRRVGFPCSTDRVDLLDRDAELGGLHPGQREPVIDDVGRIELGDPITAGRPRVLADSDRVDVDLVEPGVGELLFAVVEERCPDPAALERWVDIEPVVVDLAV